MHTTTLAPIQTYCSANLDSLTDLLTALDEQQYQQKEAWLFGSSIGQHCRHILEFYQCLVEGAAAAVIDYDQRQRDLSLESSPLQAIEQIHALQQEISKLKLEQRIQLRVNYDPSQPHSIALTSTIERELIYCLEHSIHHQALIKVGLKALDLLHLVDANFGVAPATIRHYKR